jgi:hypothetical protein
MAVTNRACRRWRTSAVMIMAMTRPRAEGCGERGENETLDGELADEAQARCAECAAKCRFMARASCRLATFAQAMKSTAGTHARRMKCGLRLSMAMRRCSGSTVTWIDL